ncbi:MAG: hypothetical protein HY674_00075 [Chloroflexi bacterium]|nr:hypothetical protein [Chloroflexota bacterium]
MKQLIAILLIVGAFLILKELISKYSSLKQGEAGSEQRARGTPSPAASESLPGMPPSMEPSFQAAQSQGAIGVKNWLARYRNYVADPRLGAIELDYVMLISRQDSAEARRVFQEVKARTPPSSPLYERIKRLENSFQ